MIQKVADTGPPSEVLLPSRRLALPSSWRWVLQGAFICAAAAFICSLFLAKVYRATTHILVSESKIGPGTNDSNLQQMAMLGTFVPFVDNDALIAASLRKFGLDRPPHDLTVDAFRRRGYFDVRLPKATRLLEVTVEFPDAAIAAGIANDLAAGAVEFNDRLNAADTAATRGFLKKELDQAEQRLAAAAESRVQLQRKAGIEAQEKELTILLSEKERLSGQLAQLRLNLVDHESRSRTLEKALAGEPRTVELQKSITTDRFLESAAEKLKLEGSPLSLTEESINTTREKVQRELIDADVNRAAESASIQVASDQLSIVDVRIAGLLGHVTTLRSDIAAAEQAYTLAVESVRNASREYQAASVTVNSKSQDMKQLAPALVPERPVRPNILLNTALGFVFGGLLVTTALFAAHQVRQVGAGAARGGALETWTGERDQ